MGEQDEGVVVGAAAVGVSLQRRENCTWGMLSALSSLITVPFYMCYTVLAELYFLSYTIPSSLHDEDLTFCAIEQNTKLGRGMKKHSRLFWHESSEEFRRSWLRILYSHRLCLHRYFSFQCCYSDNTLLPFTQADKADDTANGGEDYSEDRVDVARVENSEERTSKSHITHAMCPTRVSKHIYNHGD